MQTKHIKAILKSAARVLAILPFAAAAAFGQQTINLTAGPTTTTMPDGTTVPMWGYSCGTAVSGTTATCAALNPAGATAGTWSPVVITVPAASAGATALTINLTNNLLFTPAGTPAGTATQNGVPTSIVVLGQVGGGLGVLAQRTTSASPDHSLAQACATWFIASGATPPGVPCPALQSGANSPPPQLQGRVQSFSTEVAAGTTASLAWPSLVPGTYLLESGTHPSIQVPMGLIGVLVVTTVPAGTTAGTAYPGATTAAGTVPAVSYNAELPLEFSEIDPVQNKAVDAAVRTPGFTETNTRTLGGAIGSIAVTSGGSGYTANPAVTISAPGGTGTTATASAAVGAVITGVTLTSGGSGYSSTTTVTLPAPSSGGTQATAVPNLRFGVASITAPSGGTGAGYAVNDVLTFNTGGGAGATATVSSVTTTGAITGVTFNATTGAGSGYSTAPTISSVSGPQSVTSVSLLSGGSGYAANDTVTLTGGTTSAVVTVNTVSTTGAILTFTLTSGGAGYTTPPTANTTSGTGTGASFLAQLATGAVLTTTLSTTGSISSITVTNGGSNYATPIAASAVTISSPASGGTPAVVGSVTTAGTQGSVYSVTITNAGSMYISAPTVTIAAGTTTATALANLSPSCTPAAGVTAGGGCYPSAVNYTPFYYLINGLAFDKTHPAASVFAAYQGIPAATPAPVTTGIAGTILARLVNAGLRMHVPSIVGSLTNGFTGAGVATTTTNPVGGFTLIAEDGNPVPGVQVAGNTTVPAAPRVQTHVFMAAGKTFDVMFNVPTTTTAPALAIYSRDLGLSANSSTRDAGMLAYIGVNGAGLPAASTGAGGAFAPAVARADTYNAMVAGQPFSVSDVSKGVIANDTNVFGVTLLTAPASGTLTCNAQPQNPVPGICANGTFTYTPNATSTATSDSFSYCANGTVTAGACSSGLTAAVTLGASTLTGNPTAITQNYTALTSTYLKMPSPGLLLGNSDPNKLPLSVVTSATTTTGVVVDADGGFSASVTSGTTSISFSYTVQNSQGRTASGTANVTFPTPSNLTVNVVDAAQYQAAGCNATSAVTPGSGITCGATLVPFITDYRWIIEEDKTFWIDPNCTTNNSATTPGCPGVVSPGGTIPTFGTNFHASHMDYIAQGCTGPLSCEGGQTMLDTRPGSATLGQHIPAVCDLGNGACRPDPNCTALPCTTSGGTTQVSPGSVHLDPTKRYYISVLPGDAGNPFNPAYGPGGPTQTPNCLATPFNPDGTLNNQCGHTMGGAQVQPACNIFVTGCTSASTAAFAPVTVKVLPTPLPTAKLSVFVFEDDFPLNGEQDGGGGNGVVAPIEPGLGGFEIIVWDTYGGLGDFTGQDTHDAFNQPLSNSLAGTIDPATGLDACPNSAQVTANALPVSPGSSIGGDGGVLGSQQGITGRIVTCPKFESDNATLSPLAGQAVIANLMPDKFSIQAYPAADRIARGEEWLQTNTLDGQHPHDAFVRVGEPGYFQEFGPSGYHVSIGFANPKIINDRKAVVCAGAFGAVGPCSNTIQGQVDVQRQSRTPDQRLYASGSRDALTWTQCWVSLGDPDAEDFMFTKCDANGNFKFTGVPGGNWRLTIGDQWNDQIIDGLSTPANVGCVPTPPSNTCSGGLSLLDLGNIGVQQWQSNLYTTLFVDDNKNGIKDGAEIGVPSVYTRVKYRDGHSANVLLTDPNGVANFNETFPLFNWYVVEPDLGRYKRTGTHTVYDAGGPADGSGLCGGTGVRPCGTSTAYNFLANTYESLPLPADLHVPGAIYCAAADCTAEAAAFAAGTASTAVTNSTGRLDPPWVDSEGWSGMTSQGNWIEFGVAPFAGCNPALPASATNFCATVTYTPPGGTATTKQVGENGGIHGHTAYAATRPFDDASQMIEQPWAPNVPGVTLNLYQEGFAADGVTPTLTMVDTTVSSSWDAWAQGFYPGSSAGSGTGAGQKPYMSCPGQGTATGTNADLFFFSLFDQPEYLDSYSAIHSNPPTTPHTLPYNSQYKCYDSMHIWNQIQPAPYDGFYQFPSSLGVNATTGKPLTTFGSTNGVTSNMAGTNCTVCVPNPDTTDVYRVGTPMLPPGKYVVEVIMPPGYEVYKEEDKNLLIGDNFIGPATVQFTGLGGAIFILPDQASVASMYDPANQGFNPSNYQNGTMNLGLNEELSGVPGFPGYQDPLWPCVGELRVVPDYLSLFPQALEVAPFAGATRPLCDRKEVTLADQMSVSAKFYIYTSTHIASKYTGVITNDFTAEFDPFAPQFGEKFAPPNLPVSTKDYLGNEISRVYADHWGTYESLTFSTWEVNPPNITGYSPSMMVQCMNDKGPILDTRATIPDPNNPANPPITNPTFGQLITDPLYDPAYSQFCYEEPYMPGLTTYLDTPVVPTQAFVGAAYNNADCAYPDTTPAISEVDGDGIGPWVSATGPMTLTITALGNVQVDNSGYSGPSANVAPFNLKKVQRHYGFGTTKGTVTIGLYTVPAASITTWNDSTIILSIPANNTIAPCQIQQQAQYWPVGTTPTTVQCGQLVITTANTAAAGSPSNARQSVDTVTVTIGGATPAHVPPSQTIQSFIDQANPGDLIIVDPTCTTTAGLATACTTPSATNIHNPATHNEMVIMWKPVRLQGAGAASTIIDANAHPAGKLLTPWRQHINCFFGLALNGAPYTAAGGTNVYDPTGISGGCPDTSGAPWSNFSGAPDSPQIDRLPLEAVVGWDANLNGNIAELLQEPTLMGAYEGAGITVLAKGLEFHGQSPWSDGTEPGAFPAGTTLLTGVGPTPLTLPVGDANPLCHTVTYNVNGTLTQTSVTNPYPSNFTCNPSSIDGLSITDSSQGGGGIFIHGWAHHLQVANNRVFNNAGTLTGGISVGQGEFAGPYLVGSTTNAAPGSCSTGAGLVTNQHMPDCFQIDVNVHNNMITNNASLGDELFSATLSGGGGATICTGNDYYKFNYNWVCGNLSAGEGGGLVHLGEIQNGDIEHNSILLNQSSNPTIPTNGGGIMVQGTPDTDPICPGVSDADCAPGLSDGTGHFLMINANLIQGNSADSGSGGGIRLNQVNGSEVSTFPRRPDLWNDVAIQNNIIINNLSGWDGAGISLQDALNVQIVNNTIAHNDSLATSGVLTTSIGTPSASAPAGNCTLTGPTGANTASCPQPAGVSSTQNSTLLTTTFTGLTITCPQGHSATACRTISDPILANNIIWQNRSFQVGISAAGTGNQNQQNLVTLYNASFTGGVGGAAPAQTSTGFCSAGSYWDIGVRGDTGPTNHTGGTLSPTYSVLSSGGYGGTNSTTAPPVVTQYCNGSRVPPECTTGDGCGGPSGFGTPPGIADSVTPNPVFSFTPSATVDEGNNWINVSWGPLSLTNPSFNSGTGFTGTGNYGSGPQLANYNLTAAIDNIPANQPHPFTDFYGNLRPEPGESFTASGHFDPGAIEFGSSVGTASFSVSPSTLLFGPQSIAAPSGPMTVTMTNTGTLALTTGRFTFSGSTTFSRAGGTCSANLAVGASCTVTVVFRPTAITTYTGSLTVTYSSTIGAATGTGTPVSLSGSGVAAGPLAFTAATNGTLATAGNGARTLTFTIPANRASVTSVVTIRNNGTTTSGPTPVTISDESVAGTSNTLFSLTGTTCPVPPATLAPGATCTISITYATPVAPPPPTMPHLGTAAVFNNGSGTTNGSSNLSLVGR